MTTTRESSSTRFLITALASTSMLVATALSPALVSTASATTLSTTPSNHSPARADHRIVHHDARHDVVHYDFESDTSRPAPSYRADRHHHDNRRPPDRQTRRTGASVAPSRSGYRLMVAEILASDGRRFTLVVDYSTTPIDSRVSIERFASGREVKCSGASWSISGPAHRVGASIPTSCLGNPGWVRVGVALTAAPHNLKTSWADDSRTRGRIGDRHLKLGPRQHEA